MIPYLKKYHREKAKEYRIETIKLLGNKCNECGYNKDIRALNIDHVNGNGYIQRKYSRGITNYRHIYNEVLAGSKEYQCLCCNCNWLKRCNNKEGKNRVLSNI